MIRTLFLYYNTIKHLKYTQILWRIYYKFFFNKLKIKTCEHDYYIHIPTQEYKFYSSVKTLTSTYPLTFKFLNIEKTIESPTDWESKSHQKLWVYNLHYHNFLLEDFSLSKKEAILMKWIQENPLSRSNAWDPYPLSIRIVNWVKFLINTPCFSNYKFRESLRLQCDALYAQIEYHILGNHLFENAKALFFAGYIMEEKTGDKYIKKAIKILKKELDEQILEDGLHFERSPMYHAIFLEGLLDIYSLIIKNCKNSIDIHPLKEFLKSKIPLLLSAIQVVTHRDGEHAFFNDTTLGISKNSTELRQYADKLGFHQTSNIKKTLPIAGFVKLENSTFSFIADVGNIGPSYLPGHAHAESLSFECSVFEERVFVNSGISTYEASAERAYDRSTQAHNCITFNNKNTAETWGSFRMGKRPTVTLKSLNIQNNVLKASLTKIPYMPRNFTHNRAMELDHNFLKINDYFEGKCYAEKQAYLHLHPNFEITKKNSTCITIASKKTSRTLEIKFQTPNDSIIEIKEFEYYNEYNLSKKGKKIILSLPHTCNHLYSEISLLK